VWSVTTRESKHWLSGLELSPYSKESGTVQPAGRRTPDIARSSPFHHPPGWHLEYVASRLGTNVAQTACSEMGAL